MRTSAIMLLFVLGGPLAQAKNLTQPQDLAGTYRCSTGQVLTVKATEVSNLLRVTLRPSKLDAAHTVLAMNTPNMGALGVLDETKFPPFENLASISAFQKDGWIVIEFRASTFMPHPSRDLSQPDMICQEPL